MSRISSTLPLAVLLATLAACGGGPGTPIGPGELCREENHYQRVALEGYVGAGSGIYCSNTGGGPMRCGLILLPTQGATVGSAVEIREGGGDNAIEEVPEEWSLSTLRIHADDGSLVTPDERVRMTGEATVINGACFVSVDLIEKTTAAPPGA
jgi:hypothetical protein